MRGLVKLAKVGPRAIVLIFFTGAFLHAVYVVWNAGLTDTTGPLLWVYVMWIGIGVALLIAWAGLMIAVYWVRWNLERVRCWRAQRSGRPYVILPEDRVQPYIDGVLEPMHRSWSRGVRFEGEMGRWCEDSLDGSYRISKPLFSGARIVTFTNPDDAFAFKMRWA